MVVDGVEFEVVWAGGEGLVPDRQTKNLGFWTPPPRLYNKRSDYWSRPKAANGAPAPVDKGPKSGPHSKKVELETVSETPDSIMDYGD